MIAEGIKTITELSQKAMAVAGKVSVMILPDETFIVVSDNDVITEKPKPVLKPREIELDCVSEFGKLLKDFDERHLSKPTLWYDLDGVESVLHDQIDSRMLMHATLELRKTPQHEALLRPQATNHRSFIRQLRNTWWDCFEDNSIRDQLVATLRKLDFTNTTKSEVAVGRANYGTALAVTGELGYGLEQFGELSLSVRLFTDPSLDIRQQVTCLLDIDLEKQTFSIIPLGDSLERAVQWNLEQVQAILEATGYPTFHGRAGRD